MRLILLAWLLLPHGAALALTLGVVPQFTPVDIARRWSPLIEQLRAETGLPIELRAYKRIPDFEQDVLDGKLDLAYLNPYHMVMANKARGYIPLVRGSKPLSGVLVARRDGPVKQLRDLEGQRLVFPAPNAFGASLYLRALLTRKHQIRFEASYVGTHQNVFRQVAMGEAAAGGAVLATLDKEPAALREQLVVLYQTPEAAAHPLAAHPRVPNAARARLVQAVLKLAQGEAGRRMLDEAGLAQAVAADYARDYDPLDDLRLETFVRLE
jgi:phosphonate transport system substrate-binding protein